MGNTMRDGSYWKKEKKVVGELIQGNKVTPIYEGQDKVEYDFMPGGDPPVIRRFDETEEVKRVVAQVKKNIDAAAEALPVDERTLPQQWARINVDNPQTATVRNTQFTVDERTYRKQRPLYSGVLKYFPDALLEVAYTSWVGNEQHNPGEPLHWAKEKSTDEADALMRHLLEAGTRDTDGVRHSAKIAWRALALLQREIDAEKAKETR